MRDFFQTTLDALMQPDPAQKCAEVARLAEVWRDAEDVAASNQDITPVDQPGRPPKPERVAPQLVPKRSLATREGHAALIHALTHIEFNAINLALDAAYRFRGLPPAYYRDWTKVAAEEAYHFQLLRDHLGTLGFDYGDFPAHSGLWDMAQRTAHDVLARMALVPRVLEARGLDATPGVRQRLSSIGDQRGAALLDIIERDEIGHVAIGDRWYRHLCLERGLEPLATFRALLAEYDAPPLRPPLNISGRCQAGFSTEEIAQLMGREAL